MGPEHPELLVTLFDLGKVLRAQNKLEDALTVQEKEWKLSKKVMGQYHPETLISQQGLARTFLSLAQFEKALPLANQAYNELKKVLGSDHDFIAYSAIDLGEIWAHFNEPAKADRFFQEGLSLAAKMEYQDVDHFTRFHQAYFAFLREHDPGKLEAAQQGFCKLGAQKFSKFTACD